MGNKSLKPNKYLNFGWLVSVSVGVCVCVCGSFG